MNPSCAGPSESIVKPPIRPDSSSLMLTTPEKWDLHQLLKIFEV